MRFKDSSREQLQIHCSPTQSWLHNINSRDVQILQQSCNNNISTSAKQSNSRTLDPSGNSFKMASENGAKSYRDDDSNKTGYPDEDTTGRFLFR